MPINFKLVSYEFLRERKKNKNFASETKLFNVCKRNELKIFFSFQNFSFETRRHEKDHNEKEWFNPGGIGSSKYFENKYSNGAKKKQKK